MPRLRLKRYLITGLLTFMPLWVTWLVFKFVFGLLAGMGAPLVSAFMAIELVVAAHGAKLNQSWLTYILALVLTLIALYLIGFLANSRDRPAHVARF